MQPLIPLVPDRLSEQRLRASSGQRRTGPSDSRRLPWEAQLHADRLVGADALGRARLVLVKTTSDVTAESMAHVLDMPGAYWLLEDEPSCFARTSRTLSGSDVDAVNKAAKNTGLVLDDSPESEFAESRPTIALVLRKTSERA